MTDDSRDHNINDRVRVTLTAAGKRVWLTYTVGHPVKPNYPQANNTIEVRLWELMQVFGPHLQGWGDQLPFVDNRLTFLPDLPGPITIVDGPIEEPAEFVWTQSGFKAREAASKMAASVDTPEPAHPGLTDDERKALRCLADAWNAFVSLPVQHPDDRDEFRHAIHACQNILAWRVARRVDPDDWA